jgi:hypothetical protein
MPAYSQTRIHQTLLDQASCQADIHMQWMLLEAAHVVGQSRIGLHTNTHWRMLRLACRSNDWAEVGGQVFRLLLIPLGHLTGRLPQGNIGRSTVSAFVSMDVGPELRALIEQAQHQGMTANR